MGKGEELSPLVWIRMNRAAVEPSQNSNAANPCSDSHDNRISFVRLSLTESRKHSDYSGLIFY